MSQDIKMKPVRKPLKKVELTWIEGKVYHISVLFLVVTVILTLVGSAAIRYGLFEDHTIVIENAHASTLGVKSEAVKQEEIKDCEGAVAFYSKQYGAPEDLMQRIMRSESSNDPLVENKVSTATGCFQWIVGSWRQYGKELWKDQFYAKNVYNPKDNTELAAYVISKYGTGDWDASRHAWGSR